MGLPVKNYSFYGGIFKDTECPVSKIQAPNYFKPSHLIDIDWVTYGRINDRGNRELQK